MMIPEGVAHAGLQARQNYQCPSNAYLNGYGDCIYSGWYNWGRWVLAGAVVVIFITLFIMWTCLSNRRRRSRGLQPMYGTGWVPGSSYNNQGQQPQYNQGGWFGGFGHKNGNNNNNNYPPPPPQYTPAQPQGQQFTGQTFDSNDGYYGHHQNDVPLQQPTGTYYPRGGDPVYEPPAGPPPAKG